MELGHTHRLKADGLLVEWLAFSTRNGDCELDAERLSQWESHLETSSHKTPKNRRTVSKTTGLATPNGTATEIYSQEDLTDL